MIDYTELPKDGVRFEQLVRELYIREGFDVKWTGVGPDGGRDLLVVERSAGPIASFERTWLVSCKHFAHSGSSVGINDLDHSTVDSCRGVNASGFLLACSTQASSALTTRLSEFEQQAGLICHVTDGVGIEKRLMTPRAFSLIHLFFPATAKQVPWSIQNAGSPAFWCGSHSGHFLYMSSRIAAGVPRLQDVERMAEMLDGIKFPAADQFGQRERLRLRAVSFDEKNENYIVFVDYLVPETYGKKEVIVQSYDAKTMLQLLNDGAGLYSDGVGSWYTTYWDIMRVKTFQLGDRFAPDSREYYDPFMRDFEHGSPREGSASAYERRCLSWHG